MNYKVEISEFIDSHKNDMVALLKKFAAVPSILSIEKENMPYGKDIDEMLRLAVAEAEKLGLNASCYENRSDIIDINDRESKLAILCHLDVVPASPDGWTNPPFEPMIKDDIIYGRGVSDNKGPAVASLYAMYAVKSLNIPLKSNIRLYLGGCEENGCRDLEYYLEKNTLPEYVFTPDGCFPVGNAERGRIVVTCDTEFKSDKIISINAGKGVNIVPDYAEVKLTDIDVHKLEKAIQRASDVQFAISKEKNIITLTAYGKSTHAAHPRDGINAITALLYVLSEFDDNIKILSEYFPHGVFDGSGLGLNGGLDISITQLKINNGNMFFTADGRVDLDVSSQTLADTIKKTISYPTQMRVKEPHYTDENSDIVKRLNKVYEEYTPYKGGTYTLDAMTYAHEIQNGVIFGGVIPGDGCANAHSIDECYSLNTLIESAKIFAGAIVEFCGE